MARYLGGLTWWELVKRTTRRSMEHKLLDQAANMAFYFLLSLFPLTIFLLSILSLVASGAGIEGHLVQWITEIMPQAASGMVQSVIEQTRRGTGSGELSFGLLFALYSASTGMVAVIEALNVAFEVKQQQSWIRQRFRALWLTIAIGLFILLAVGIILFGSWIVGWVGKHAGLSAAAAAFWQEAQWPLAVFLVVFAFAMVYRYAPDKPNPAWKWVTPGAVIGVLLWLAASFGFRLYLAYFNNYAATYGSLGAVIILMMWFYVTALAVLLGGEVDSQVQLAARRKSFVRSGGESAPRVAPKGDVL